MNRTVVAWIGKGAQLESQHGLPSGEFHVIFCDTLEELRSAGSKAKLTIVAGASRDGHDPLQLANLLRSVGYGLPMILIVPQSSPDLAAAAYRAGFNEYLRLPISPAEVLAAVHRSLDAAAAGRDTESGGRLIGDSAKMRDVKARIRDVARADCNVLITGETGTGKELVAELIHMNSARRGRPLVSVNCAAIPDSLWESELFGFEKGAFTGAHMRKPGTLEAANGGTIFFDEIGEMSQAAQAKMLRVIESRQIVRLGGASPVPLNIRIVAATNRDLEALVERAQFRPDLYFRLSVARIHLPPLRERPEDVPALVNHFTREFNAHFGRNIEGLSEETARCLSSHHWPGNVRELRNVIEASFVHLPFGRMRFLEVPEEYRARLAGAHRRHLCELDRLRSSLAANNWNISRTARVLNWSRVTLYRKMAKYHLDKPIKVVGD